MQWVFKSCIRFTKKDGVFCNVAGLAIYAHLDQSKVDLGDFDYLNSIDYSDLIDQDEIEEMAGNLFLENEQKKWKDFILNKLE